MARILAVDDDPRVLALEQLILQREGFELVTAQDGSSAMRLLSEQKFDLVLLDVTMPGIDGFAVSRAVGRQGTATPVVFVTARDDPASMREGFRAGGTVFLSKPFTARQLTRMVRAMLER